MRLGSVEDWAKSQGISRQAAYKRIREHGIPYHSPGRLDMDAADQIWEASVNPAKQRGGVAGGEAAAEVHQSGLFGDDDGPAASPADPAARSVLARVQIQREILRIKREKLTIEQMEGSRVPLADVRAWEAQAFAAVKNALLVIPAELCDELAEETNPARCRELVERRINQALNELAQWEPSESVTQ